MIYFSITFAASAFVGFVLAVKMLLMDRDVIRTLEFWGLSAVVIGWLAAVSHIAWHFLVLPHQ